MIAHSASPGRAGQLLLGLDQTIGGQTNIFGLSENPISDGTYELRPTVRFLAPEGKFSYDLSYSPGYEVFFQSDGLNGVDHFSRSTLEYEILPVASLVLHADIADFRATSASTVEGIVPRAIGDINRIFADLEYEHHLSPTTRAMGTVSFQRYGFTTADGVESPLIGGADSLGFGAEVEAVHELVPIFGIGGSLFGSLRSYEEQDPQPASRNAVLNPNLVLTMNPAPTVFLTLRGGPAVLFTRTDSSDSGGVIEDELVTGFVTAELTKEESWGQLKLAFRRGEDASAGGSGSTTIRDSITAELIVHAGERWTGNLLANWNQRKSRTFVDTEFGTESFRTRISEYWLDLRLTRRLSDRLQLGFMLRYLRQDREVDGRQRGKFDNVIGQATIRFSLAPLEYSARLGGLR